MRFTNLMGECVRRTPTGALGMIGPMAIELQPMTEYGLIHLARWLRAPHVAKWWRRDGRDAETFMAEYEHRLRGHDPTLFHLVLENGAPVGMLQCYRNDDYPEHAASVGLADCVGVDLLVGDEANLGRGLGPAMLRVFIEQVVPVEYPDAQFVATDPSAENAASIRAFEKAGFYRNRMVDDGDGPKQIMICGLPVEATKPP